MDYPDDVFPWFATKDLSARFARLEHTFPSGIGTMLRVMLPPPGQCMWCDSTDMNVEHVLGNQILKKALGVDQPAKQVWGDYVIPFADSSSEIKLPDRVCTTCNGGWMRRLDGGHVILPNGGHRNSPLAAAISPHGRPLFSPPILS